MRMLMKTTKKIVSKQLPSLGVGLSNSGIVYSSTKKISSKENRDLPRNLKEVQSVEGHKAPLNEDTVAGKYSQTLFVTSSMANDLFNAYNDMLYILDVYNSLPEFKTIKNNAGLSLTQISGFCNEIAECGNFCQTTRAFLALVAENKRFNHIDEIAHKYIKLYQLLSKEEKITIISAQELNDHQKDDVKKALLSNPENEGKTFIIDYSVNPSILGGLQMYSENKFMDLSLNSRVEKLKDEVNKLI